MSETVEKKDLKVGRRDDVKEEEEKKKKLCYF